MVAWMLWSSSQCQPAGSTAKQPCHLMSYSSNMDKGVRVHQGVGGSTYLLTQFVWELPGVGDGR
jgi:hypothetical protein